MGDGRISGAGFVLALKQTNTDAPLTSKEALDGVDGIVSGERDGKIDATERAVFLEQAKEAGVGREVALAIIAAAEDPQKTVPLPPKPGATAAAFTPPFFDLATVTVMSEASYGVVLSDAKDNRMVLVRDRGDPPQGFRAHFYRNTEERPTLVPFDSEGGTPVSKGMAAVLTDAVELAVRKSGGYQASGGKSAEPGEQWIMQAAQNTPPLTSIELPLPADWSKAQIVGFDGGPQNFSADFTAGSVTFGITCTGGGALMLAPRHPAGPSRPISADEWSGLSDGLQLARINLELSRSYPQSKALARTLEDMT